MDWRLGVSIVNIVKKQWTTFVGYKTLRFFTALAIVYLPTIKDVDDDVIKRFKKWAAKKGRIEESALDEPKEVLMKKLHLMNNGYLTNAAMLLFSNDPETWQLGAFTKIGFFKDYARGIPIQVSVYDDRLYIANCGRLPESWSVKKLMEKHSSEPFNPNIAHVYYLAGFIESWGRGIEKMCQACREDHVPLPEYDITGNSVMIRFIAPEDRVVYGPSKNGTVNGTVAFTEKERQILELLSEDPAYTYQELANRLNIGRKAVFGRIKKLKDKGTLQRVGSDKSGYWKINM